MNLPAAKKRFHPSEILTLIAWCAAAFAVYAALVFFLDPIYALKAFARFSLFFLIPLGYQLTTKEGVLRRLGQRFRARPIPWRLLATAFLGGAVFIGLAYVLSDPLNRVFGIEAIASEVTQRTDSTRHMLIAAMFYIPLVNAFAEEAFFRGFLFLELRRLMPEKVASLASALMFALYHLTIFRSWFGGILYLAAMLGLVFAGLILNEVVRKDGHVLRAWILHAFFNVAALALALPFFPS